MRGNITRRGKSSWRIKYDVGADETGKRLIQYKTVRGTKREAEMVLARLLNELAEGRYVAPTVETVGSYAHHWLANVAPATRSAVTIERYRSIIETHIKPALGSVPLQGLDGVKIDRFYAHLRENGRRGGGGLSSMTMHHVHTLLGQILASAVKAKRLARSPISDAETAPKPKRQTVEVLNEDEVAALLNYLQGHWLYMPVLTALSTGLRRGEVVALRWQDIDLDKARLQVDQSVEELNGQFRFKAPKTDRGRRTIDIPARLVEALKQHRKEQSAMRLRLGLGKDANDLVFTTLLGDMLYPNYVTEALATECKAAGVKRVRFHALRHTHLSLLLRSGVPVHTVAARAGHAKASTTLDNYAHLLGGEDGFAASIADAILAKAIK
jgi:integrase